ncbi:MAG: hypothetical protein ACI9H8_000279 [Lysobacterales bacterium]|jgi:hypothetical protein
MKLKAKRRQLLFTFVHTLKHVLGRPLCSERFNRSPVRLLNHIPVPRLYVVHPSGALRATKSGLVGMLWFQTVAIDVFSTLGDHPIAAVNSLMN